MASDENVSQPLLPTQDTSRAGRPVPFFTLLSDRFTFLDANVEKMVDPPWTRRRSPCDAGTAKIDVT